MKIRLKITGLVSSFVVAFLKRIYMQGKGRKPPKLSQTIFSIVLESVLIVIIPLILNLWGLSIPFSLTIEELIVMIVRVISMITQCVVNGFDEISMTYLGRSLHKWSQVILRIIIAIILSGLIQNMLSLWGVYLPFPQNTTWFMVLFQIISVLSQYIIGCLNIASMIYLGRKLPEWLQIILRSVFEPF